MPALDDARSGVPVAIIDIGSNSVRLVVYEGRTRSPTPLYNEKLLCGLGRGVATTGRLPKDAVERALKALARFRVLCRQMEVADVTVLATAAARDAENGPTFLEAAAAACGQPIELLTGEREAALSALGVTSGFHEPDGIVGDLGGGSLELVEVGQSPRARGVTLPLGGLALQDLAEGSPRKAQKIARDKLRDSKVLRALEGRTFYAVGGTWRAIARLQMLERAYPLHVMHGYRLAPEEAGFLRLAESVGTAAVKEIDGISDARRPLLVYGAVVLDEIVRTGQPSSVVMSALGVREGLLYDALPDDERRRDPLVAAASDLNRLRSRSPRHGEDLCAWTDAFVASSVHDENPYERRLRHAACLLSDIGWRAHPDYRGDQSVALIAHGSFLGIDHPGRAYLSLAVLFRHVGLSLDKAGPDLPGLAGERLLGRARLLGALLRVAYPVTAAMGGVLPQTPLLIDRKRLVLTLPRSAAALASERLSNRLRALSRLIEREPAIEVV